MAYNKKGAAPMRIEERGRKREDEKLSLRKARAIAVKHLENDRKKKDDYILLPYGQFYPETKRIGSASGGELMRFFNGGYYEIDKVIRIKIDSLCDMLCRNRYGVSIQNVIKKWKSNARLEGYKKISVSDEECYIVFYATDKM